MLRPAAAWKGSLHWATQESQEIVKGLMLSHSNPSAAFPQIPQNTLSETYALCGDTGWTAQSAWPVLQKPPLPNYRRGGVHAFVSKSTHKYEPAGLVWCKNPFKETIRRHQAAAIHVK